MRIAEIFYSIQGEGALTGVPSVFVRTSGCNLRCVWCDTPYTSWAPEGDEWSVARILSEVERHPARHAVITGGEPMIMRDLPELVRALRDRGRHVTLETNATRPPAGLVVDLASLSPKLRHAAPDPARHPREAALHAAEAAAVPEVLRAWIDAGEYQLKFVVASGEDVAEMQALLGRLERDVPPERVMLMPEGVTPEALEGRRAELAALCLRFGYRYCDRLHIALFGNRRGT